MKPEELNQKLVAAFPELKDEIEAYLNQEEGLQTGSFLLFEDVFVPYAAEALNENNELSTRVAQFIEDTHDTNDEYAQNVIVVGVLENLKANAAEEKISSQLIGKTKELFDSLEY